MPDSPQSPEKIKSKKKENGTGNDVLPSSGEDPENSREDTDSKISGPLRKKIEAAERNFSQRYPRDQSGTALRQLGQFLPKPLAKVDSGNVRNETDEAKIAQIIGSLDLDGNGAGSPWELHDWMLWVEKRVHQHVVEDQVKVKLISLEQINFFSSQTLFYSVTGLKFI